MTKRKEVLLLLTGYPPDHAGAGSRIHKQYLRLNAVSDIFSWTVITKRENADTVFLDGPKGIITPPFPKNVRLPAVIICLIEFLWALAQLKRGVLKNIDFVHLAGWSFYMLPIVYFAHKKGIRIIREMVTTGDTGFKPSFGASLIRATNNLSSTFIAISPTIRDLFLKTSAGREADVWVRPNPVDMSVFKLPSFDSKRAARSFFNKASPKVKLYENDIVVGMLGRIRLSKGQDLLIDAFAKLPKNYKLLIVGPSFSNDDYFHKLVDKVTAYSLQSRVIILNENLLDPTLMYNILNVFAFSSIDEGLGNVVIEAMCCGVPVVGFRGVGGNDWVIKNGLTGYICERTAIDFAKKIQKASNLVISDKQLLAYKKWFATDVIDDQFIERLKNHAH